MSSIVKSLTTGFHDRPHHSEKIILEQPLAIKLNFSFELRGMFVTADATIAIVIPSFVASRYLIGKLDKATGKMQVYDAEMFNLKPVLTGNYS